jgi:hypothetical protein
MFKTFGSKNKKKQVCEDFEDDLDDIPMSSRDEEMNEMDAFGENPFDMAPEIMKQFNYGSGG